MLTPSTVTFIALTALFAYSFYAVLYAGQLSLAQAGFASLGGFTATLVVPEHPIAGLSPIIVGVPVGAAVGAFAAFVLGIPVMRLRGVYLAIATVGFGEVVRIILINLPDWTGGANGTVVHKWVTPGIAWTALIVVAYWFWRLAPSRLGRALTALREDELAARAMGIDVTRHRMFAFVAAGAIAGVYGVLITYFSRLISPNDFNFPTAVNGLVTAVVGGSVMFVGPLLGSTFFTLVPEIQRAVGVQAGWIRPLISNILLLVVILFLPGGFAGLIPLRRSKVPSDAAIVGTKPLPEPGTPLVSLTEVSKDYGGVHAVRDVSLEIHAGEVVGLIGPNGAGKTTLVNILTGLTAPSQGHGTVAGIDLGSAAPHAFPAAGVLRTFQQSKLFDRLTVLDNVVIGAHVVSRPTLLRRLLWLPSARRDEQDVLHRAAAALGRVGLSDQANSKASQLSYGDRRRVEIARALAAHPALLILDEPAAGMNHVEAAELSDVIRRLAADGITILLIEHNVRMVLNTCQRILVLEFGALIADGTPADITSNPAVVAAYLGSEAVS
ncbi:MAG: branched-chain amino acid ABC transporter ATP-binding protein/permease [Nocardiaceae bacterium]|nr:branched-chain amino acid ABC transporter ATP-binding protein/permease [Nocardiaceae bacterium]